VGTHIVQAENLEIAAWNFEKEGLSSNILNIENCEASFIQPATSASVARTVSGSMLLVIGISRSRPRTKDLAMRLSALYDLQTNPNENKNPTKKQF